MFHGTIHPSSHNDDKTFEAAQVPVTELLVIAGQRSETAAMGI